MIKPQFKKIVCALMALCLVAGSFVPVHATVDETQNIEESTTASTSVTYTQGSTFTVTIPKTITIDADKTASYEVSVVGDIASNEKIIVIPNKVVTLKDVNSIKDNVEGTITQTKTEWSYKEASANTSTTGNIVASSLSAGDWRGTFDFSINLKSSITVSAKNEAGEDLNASAEQITGQLKDDLLSELDKSGLVDSSEVDELIEVESDDFDGLAETTFNVSGIAKEGDKVVILHFNEETNKWEYISTKTVDSNGKITSDFSSYSPVAFVVIKEDGTMETCYVTLQSGSLFNANIPLDTTEIIFTYDAIPKEATFTDVSDAQDGSILAWSEGTTMYVAPAEIGKTIIANPDCKEMFSNIGSYEGNTLNVKSIDFNNFNTSNITNMSEMFYFAGYNAETFELDLSNWDVSSVTDMNFMFSFAGNSATTWDLGDLSSWDVSNVTDMSDMFAFAGENATIWDIGNLSSWDVSNVTIMSSMFGYTGHYATTWNIGDLSNWNVSNVTEMSSMFNYAGYGTSTWNIGTLNHWDVSNVTTMNNMFAYAGACATAWDIGNLSNWKMSNVYDMSNMFECAGYSANTWNIGNLSSWDVSNVINMSSMFGEAGYCSETWDIGDISNWDVSNVKYMYAMFSKAGYSADYTLDLADWDVSNISSYSNFNYGVETKVLAPTWVN